jgi:hypothetical protein
MGYALIDAYTEAFVLDGTVPEHADLVELERKIEILFAGGH